MKKTAVIKELQNLIDRVEKAKKALEANKSDTCDLLFEYEQGGYSEGPRETKKLDLRLNVDLIDEDENGEILGKGHERLMLIATYLDLDEE